MDAYQNASNEFKRKLKRDKTVARERDEEARMWRSMRITHGRPLTRLIHYIRKEAVARTVSDLDDRIYKTGLGSSDSLGKLFR